MTTLQEAILATGSALRISFCKLVTNTMLIAICLPLGGCGGSEDEGPALPLTWTEELEDGSIIEYTDTDRDGTPEVAKFYTLLESEEDEEPERLLTRQEVDLNGDGTYNLTRRYDEEGELNQEDMDTNLDGRTDHVVFWQEGVIMRTERDEDFNGVTDSFRHYREGFLIRVLRDTDGDGDIDMWSYYDRHGLVRVGRDTTGNGAADRWTRRPPPISAR